MSRVTRTIEEIVTERGQVLELVAIAVVTALGINLIANALAMLFSARASILLIVGLAVTLVGVAVIATRIWPLSRRRFRFEGVFLVYPKEQFAVVPIEEYEFSENMARNFRALLTENKALAVAWKKQHLGASRPVGLDSKVPPTVTANELVVEAVEYYVVERLSLHLSSYFHNNATVDQEQLVALERKDVPDILLKNHFLSTFTTPMDQREAFIGHTDGGVLRVVKYSAEDIVEMGLDAISQSDKGRVVSAHGKKGEIFDEFELILPKGTRLARSLTGGLEILTNRFEFTVEPEFGGYSAVLPSQFEELYLGAEFGAIHAYKVDVVISIKFSLKSLFTVSGWNYYRWLDSFLEQFESGFSFEQFVQSIDWASALATARAVRSTSESSK